MWKKKDFKKIDPGVKKVVNIEVSKVVEVDKTAQKPGMGSKQQHGLEEKSWANMLLKINKKIEFGGG
jgi:hypothetical protein